MCSVDPCILSNDRRDDFDYRAAVTSLDHTDLMHGFVDLVERVVDSSDRLRCRGFLQLRALLVRLVKLPLNNFIN